MRVTRLIHIGRHDSFIWVTGRVYAGGRGRGERHFAGNHWGHKSTARQHTAARCNTLYQAATHCNTLQHTATHCNTLQHTATHCDCFMEEQDEKEYTTLRAPIGAPRRTPLYGRPLGPHHKPAWSATLPLIRMTQQTSYFARSTDENNFAGLRATEVTNLRKLPCISWISLVTHMYESCHTHE